jgi:hypothetical protein
MSYIRKNGNGLMGFGDASSCGSNQQWDANCNFNGIVGQCVPTGMVGKAAGCTYASGGSSSGGGIFDSILKSVTDVIKAKVTPAQVTNISTTEGPGLSTPTKLAIAGGAVVAGVLLVRALKK